MWQIIASLGFLYFLATFIWACKTFDDLVRLEYHTYRNLWERDGQPNGYFWRPPENRKLRLPSDREWFQWTSKQVTDKWLISTPEWIRDDLDAFRLLRRFRTLRFVLFDSLVITIITIAIVLIPSMIRDTGSLWTLLPTKTDV